MYSKDFGNKLGLHVLFSFMPRLKSTEASCAISLGIINLFVLRIKIGTMALPAAE